MEENNNENNWEDRRALCHSTSEAEDTLASLLEIWNHWLQEDGNTSFMKLVFKPFSEDANTSGQKQVDNLIKIKNSEQDEYGNPWDARSKTTEIKIALVKVITAYCIQASRAKKNSTLAWSYAVDATRWLGFLQGVNISLGDEQQRAASEFGKRGADAAHEENRALKKFLMEWCDSNMTNFTSMDAAAEAVAGKVVPVKFRTARNWIGEWKKLQSAGKQ